MINAITGVPAITLDPTYKAKTTTDNEGNQEIAQQSSGVSNLKAKDKKDLESEETKMNKVSYDELAKTLKNLINDDETSLEFKIDKDTNKMVLKIIDSQSKEVIRQIPPEIALKISRLVAEILGNGQVADAKV
ncbi:MAG TPA: flagellar protein FlaG [Candidatus Kapabacteria bacterium]|nr:flagellar protein FlaG [Candidatus Kapabacteria bacterium]HOV92130.1 flagellar protein FlaG [Candidatus Kapabacteria bacterium]